ncbi:hypothetical protein Taro_048471 [Colocasia esculenta]|uniref:Uncharacterized protein n=1 Tax=Colocasia esculenta TaxID=4460 RepID=A0A843X879_COLES|nr:hypothetical protein [Colocasia esculenta]
MSVATEVNVPLQNLCRLRVQAGTAVDDADFGPPGPLVDEVPVATSDPHSSEAPTLYLPSGLLRVLIVLLSF